MKLRILEKKYKRESIFVIQHLEGNDWVEMFNHGPYHTLERAREAADILANPVPYVSTHKEIIHDYP